MNAAARWAKDFAALEAPDARLAVLTVEARDCAESKMASGSSFANAER